MIKSFFSRNDLIIDIFTILYKIMYTSELTDVSIVNDINIKNKTIII